MNFTLRCRAPFAAFRWMQAGVWRATSPVIPPSAAWGLVLNLAGIETREDRGGPTTLVRADAPAVELAVGALGQPELASLYQQLHSYPVGNSGAEFKARSHGSKYWIAPARRELLTGVEFLLAVRGGPEDLRARVEAGLKGTLEVSRYGLPFAGDNNFLFDDITVISEPVAAQWYERLDDPQASRVGSCRLTIGIDRADASRTTSALFAPTAEPMPVPPESAWVWVPRRAET
jgi:CRISPR-associated protein Cas5t